MNVRAFFKLVWPVQGFYCTAIPHINKTTGKRGYKHAMHDDIEEAYQDTRARYRQHDMYFGIFTHAQKFIHNQLYGYATPSRKHDNMDEAKVLFLDLDVGKPEKDKKKYASQEHALSALARFLFRTGLPVPIVVSSGNGLHIYWPFEQPLQAAEWRPHAQTLRLLLDHHTMLYDPSRTTDMSSVLRVPATLNHKDPTNLKDVKILVDGDGATSNQVLFGLLAEQTHGLQRISVGPVGGAMTSSGFPMNIGPGANFPPTDPDDVAAQCEQIRIFRDSKGNISEPHWYVVIGALIYTTNGEAKIHEWSSGYPGYSFDETQAKIDQWKANASVTSCAKIASDGVLGVCQRCPHFGGQFKNPIIITNKQPVQGAAPPPPPQIPPPVAFLPTPSRPAFDPLSVVPPPTPHGFNRTAGLGITHTDTSKNPPVVMNVIEQYDLYPIWLSKGVNANGTRINSGVSTWIAREHTQRGIEPTVFVVENGAISNKETLSVNLITNGLFFPVTPKVQTYMSAYLKQLKAHQGTLPQHTYTGWANPKKLNKFVLNGFAIDRTGATEPCVMAKETDIGTNGMSKSGDLQGQIDALKFYSGKTYAPHKFLILCSLANPLLIATGINGVVVNAWGDSGASKSSALTAAAGIWADPQRFMLNGTERGISSMARELRAMTLPNLPTCLDEITHMDPHDATTMVMTWSQPTLRQTLTADRKLREAKFEGQRAAYLLSSSNGDLHQSVNSESHVAGTANSARILQMLMDRSRMAHTKAEADLALEQFKLHYGHLGEDFMRRAMPTIDLLMDSVRRMVQKLDRTVNAAPVMRFLTAAAAPVFVAGAFAVYHGLLDWDMDELFDWFVNEQWPALVVDMAAQQGYVDPARVLRQFINDQTLNTIQDDGTGNIPPAPIKDQVVVHVRSDRKEMYISLPVFKAWCSKRGSSMTDLIEKLYASGVIKLKETRKVLGKGTRYAGVTNVVFVVDTDNINK